MASTVTGPVPSGGLEAHMRGPEADDVAVAQPLLAVEADAVDHRAVGGAEVDEQVADPVRADLGALSQDPIR